MKRLILDSVITPLVYITFSKTYRVIFGLSTLKIVNEVS